jgi:DNA polymerase III gamma/tau subunit
MRIICVDEAHKITPQAAEALLKPLEEPPPKTLWILATSEPDALKPTLRNRCRHLPIETVPVDILSKFLLSVAKREEVRLPKEVAIKVAEASGGYIRQSLSTLDVVLSYMASNGEVEAEQLVQLVETSILKAGDEAISRNAMRIVYSMLSGNITGIVRCMAEVNEYVPLANKVIQFAQFGLDVRCSAKGKNVWYTPENKQFLSIVNSGEAKFSVATYAAVLQGATLCRAEMQKFAVQERALMTSLYTQTAANCK